MLSARRDIRIFHCSWQPERQVPFEDVRLPPPADTKKEIREGEEVEVRKAHPIFLNCSPLAFIFCVDLLLLI